MVTTIAIRWMKFKKDYSNKNVQLKESWKKHIPDKSLWH